MAARHIVDNVCRGSPLPRARLRAKAATATPATASTPAQNIQWFASVIANGRASSSSVRGTAQANDATTATKAIGPRMASRTPARWPATEAPTSSATAAITRSKPDWPSHMRAGPGPSLDVRTMGRTPATRAAAPITSMLPHAAPNIAHQGTGAAKTKRAWPSTARPPRTNASIVTMPVAKTGPATRPAPVKPMAPSDNKVATSGAAQNRRHSRLNSAHIALMQHAPRDWPSGRRRHPRARPVAAA